MINFPKQIKMNTPVTIALAAVVLSLAACSNNQSGNVAAKKDTAGQSRYRMEFSAGSGTPASGVPVRLMLTPKMIGDGSKVVTLDVTHERKIHLIAVSDDLSWFQHLHPEAEADGSYAVSTTFPAGGKYLLYADYKPAGGTQTTDRINLDIAGAPMRTPVVSEKLSGTAAGYTIALQPAGGKIFSGDGTAIDAALSKNGKPIDPATLEDYLGAKAHVVVIDVADKKYLHVHPMVDGGKYQLHTKFEKPGIHRWWIQFMADDTLRTIDLTTNVVAGGDAGSQKGASDMKDHDAHEHAGH